MASLKPEFLGSIAASMRDRPALPGETTPALPGETAAPARSSVLRQSEGRRRLEAACVIELDRIIPDPNQPRTEFDPGALEQLAASLKARGQLQPIRVRWDDAASRYVVVVGERRWRAAQLAGMETIACIVIAGNPSPEDLLEDQLVENCLREDLKPIEQARAYQSLLSSRGLSLRQLAERLQIAPSAIAKALALLELPESIQARVEQGALPPATAYAISHLPDPAAQEEMAARATSEGLTRAAVEEAVRARRPPAPRPRKVEYKTPAGARVIVTLPDPEAGDHEVIAALQHVLKILRRARDARDEAA